MDKIAATCDLVKQIKMTIILLIKSTTENSFLTVHNKRISNSIYIISNTIIEAEDKKGL